MEASYSLICSGLKKNSILGGDGWRMGRTKLEGCPSHGRTAWTLELFELIGDPHAVCEAPVFPLSPEAPVFPLSPCRVVVPGGADTHA